jgi:hypothetical protein
MQGARHIRFLVQSRHIKKSQERMFLTNTNLVLVLMKGGSFDAIWLYCEAIETADIRAEHASTEGD